MAAEPATPRYLNWSQYPIQFSREDQWTSVGNAGHYPLVLGPTITGMTVTKLLIDGGAVLNIIFSDTLKRWIGILQDDHTNERTVLWNSTRQSSHATQTNHITSHIRDAYKLSY